MNQVSSWQQAYRIGVAQPQCYAVHESGHFEQWLGEWSHQGQYEEWKPTTTEQGIRFMIMSCGAFKLIDRPIDRRTVIGPMTRDRLAGMMARFALVGCWFELFAASSWSTHSGLLHYSWCQQQSLIKLNSSSRALFVVLFARANALFVRFTGCSACLFTMSISGRIEYGRCLWLVGWLVDVDWTSILVVSFFLDLARARAMHNVNWHNHFWSTLPDQTLHTISQPIKLTSKRWKHSWWFLNREKTNKTWKKVPS